MSKLYEINEHIDELLRALEPDEETGELPENEEELLDELMAAEEDRASVLKWIAKAALNARSEAMSAQVEAERLTERKRRAKSKEERLLAILDRECGGRKTDLGVATLSYRKSSSLDIDDETACVEWLKDTGNAGAYKETISINKVLLKRAMGEENEVPGAHVVSRMSASLR